jgi:putative ABC transport system permease protein
MEDAFATKREEARFRGWRRLARFWVREAVGLVVVALSERYGVTARAKRRRLRAVSQWKAGRMETFGQSFRKNVQFALRLMRRSPGFTAIVLLTIAIGTGANTLMFSVVNTVLLRPLPYSDAERLTLVRPVQGSERSPGMAAAPDFYRYRAENRSFEDLDAFYGRNANVTGGGEPERVTALIVSSGFFRNLGVQPATGRGFVGKEEEWGSHRVAVISDGLWQRRLGGHAAAVGQSLTIDGEPYEIIGILPRAFSFLNADTQVFLPMAFAPGDNMNSHSNYFLRMIGRLKPDVTRQQATTDLNVISDDIIAKESVNRGTSLSVTPFQEALVGNIQRPVLILLGAVGFVLLISCANLANLLLSRAASRQKEVAVRMAIGASRRQLVAQFLVESLILALAGSALGLGLAYFGINAVNLVSPQILPRAEDVGIDPVVLIFTLAVATVTGIAMGLAPAIHGSRTELAGRLNDGSRTASEGGGHRRLREAMVVVQVALSLVLLAGAGLMIKSVYQVLNVDAGFVSDRVLTLQISLPPRKYIDSGLAREFRGQAFARVVAFFTQLAERTQAVPGVQSVGAINGLPLMGEIWGKNVTLYDRPLPADMSGLKPIQYRVVAGDYFRAMGIRILSGRSFTDRDTLAAPRVAIINRAMATRDWPDQDPIGKIISVNPPVELLPRKMVEDAQRNGTLPRDYRPDLFTIVGVAEDTHYSGLTTAAVPLVYAPLAQGAEGTTNMFLVVRAQGDPLSLVAPIREQIKELDPEQPVSNIQTMDSRIATSVARPRLQTTVLGVFALVAILLAAVGIYGVMSYAVSQRAKEIGIRLALGAARGEVRALILRGGLVMVATGMVVGLGAAFLLSRVLRTLLFEVSTADPMVFAVVALLLVVTAGLAALIPARRAARMDPIATLRAE